MMGGRQFTEFNRCGIVHPVHLHSNNKQTSQMFFQYVTIKIHNVTVGEHLYQAANVLPVKNMFITMTGLILNVAAIKCENEATHCSKEVGNTKQTQKCGTNIQASQIYLFC